MNISPVGQPFSKPVSIETPQDDSDEEDLLETSDPELGLRKRLLEALFGARKEKGLDPNLGQARDEAAKERDSVEISAQAAEMYRRDELNIRYENGGEQLQIRYERVEAARVEMRTAEGEVQQAEPLVLDLDGNGIELTDVRAGQGVRFDLTGDGRAETVSWVSPADAFLAYDRNGNGAVDGGNELFGDQHGAANGFEELAKFDDNRDGVIDTRDSIFNTLWVWRDTNMDGASGSNELGGLADYGITSISLTPDNTRETVAGNLIAGYADYQAQNARRQVGEVFLNFIA